MAIEHAAACVLSAAAVMLLSPWICRSWENSRVFSAAQGIILYAIVKSIIVECGWGFAAAAGVRPGLMLEAIAMCGGLTIFGELGGVLQKENRSRILPAAAVILFCAGKGMLTAPGLVPSSAAYVTGRASVAALVTAAAFIVCNDGRPADARSVTCFAAVCQAGSFAAESLLRQAETEAPSLLAPFLIMMSCCGLTFVFSRGMKNAPVISASCFAAGLLLLYGFDCMTG